MAESGSVDALTRTPTPMLNESTNGRCNADYLKLYYDEWRLANPEKVSAKAHKRRARKLGSTEHFTGDDVRLICEAQGNACAYCWVPLTAGMKANDHFIPLAGKDITGSNGPDNLILACTSCNARKSNRQPDVFIKADYPRLLQLRASHGEPTRLWPLLPILEIIDSFFPQPERTTL